MIYAPQSVLIGMNQPSSLECRDLVCVLAGSSARPRVKVAMPYLILLGMLKLQKLPAGATVTTNGTHNSPSKKPLARKATDIE
jgi:hypothetical protein